MIRTISEHRVCGEAPSPFMRTDSHHPERPLRLTIHCPKVLANHDQALALTVVRELAHLPEFDAVDTEGGSLTRLEPRRMESGEYVAVTNTPEGEGGTFMGAVDTDEWATRLNHADRCAEASADLLIAAAHSSLRADLLVTLSPHLLALRDRGSLKRLNICTPKEAAGIIGLLLRSRENYTYRRGERGGTASVDRLGFYLVLAREHLPALWRYFSACVYASKALGDDELLELGGTMLSRSEWALQARDFIGIQHHQPHTHSTSDIAMYHFGLLTVLLVGIFDAQAHITKRAYRLTTSDMGTSLWNPDFRRQLGTSGGDALRLVLEAPRSQDVSTVLKSLRNTVHSAALQAMGVQEHHAELVTLAEVPPRRAIAVWEAAERLGGAARWGLRRQAGGIQFELYVYARELIDTCFRFVNDIADATDVLKLFPAGSAIPNLTERPPATSIFQPGIRDRVALLGG